MYRGYEITRNEYGTYNVSTINCIGAETFLDATHAIDAHIERIGQ